MAKRKFKKFGKTKCSGEYFWLKMKGGKKRCVCAAFSSDGRFVTQFSKSDRCPVRSKALTWKQAQRKYS
jgi:hypothetical protein